MQVSCGVKRNQVEEAISCVVAPTAEIPPADLLNRLKRLLDTDRNLGRNANSPYPEKATYAFYSGDASGSGVEVWFQEYEAFALLIGLRLLEHGFPQQKSVLALRSARPQLEQEHARIMKLDPKATFDQKALRRAAQPGQLAVGNLAPVFLVIYSGTEARNKIAGAKPVKSISVCRGEAEMMRAIKANLGLSTIFEIVGTVHLLHRHLSTTKPSRRGRSASGLIHSDDSQIGRSSSSSRHESRNCCERQRRRSPSA
jgi:hypothetical protein